MPDVILHNEPHAEDNAMLQALYSRSADSVKVHIEKLKQVGSGKFMSQYYLGYGHASIGDCGFVTVYIEGVSMLAAKAIQDNFLYNGQESSSRYIDWANQEFYNPYPARTDGSDKAADEILEAIRSFYVTQKPIIIEHLKVKYPRKAEEKETVYEKAITAKAFDILRGYLPCGATTNVAWTTSLRKANEQLAWLALHPLEEMRNIAVQTHAVLVSEYPSSIGSLPDYETADPYLKHMDNYYGHAYGPGKELDYSPSELEDNDTLIRHHCFRVPEGITNTIDMPPSERPKRAPLLKHMGSYRARIQIDTVIDFGSFRDLQRHRGGYIMMPLVNVHGSFHSWYYDELPDSSKKEADALFTSIENLVNLFGKQEDFDLKFQYILPMGTLVPVTMDYDVQQTLYVAELRSSQTVHATLRPLAQRMGKFLEDELGIKTYCDFTGDEWNTRRGTQDIISKQEVEK